jgi:hypothetical protein
MSSCGLFPKPNLKSANMGTGQDAEAATGQPEIGALARRHGFAQAVLFAPSWRVVEAARPRAAKACFHLYFRIVKVPELCNL